MNLIRRLALAALLGISTLRVGLYLVYACYQLPFPLEVHNLEARMVLLAYRAEHGLGLYPDWEHYPHVANFFGPVYFALVGSLGRAWGADIPELFSIGRTVTFASSLATTVAVSVWVGRRYGFWAGVAGAAVSLGTGPMYGFSIMARPDALAEFFGVTGYLLCSH